MADTGFLPNDKVASLLEALSRKQKVFVPIREAGVVRFMPYGPEATLCFERPANLPPKDIIFPQSDALFSFSYTKDPEDPRIYWYTPTSVSEYLVNSKVMGSGPDNVIDEPPAIDTNVFTVYNVEIKAQDGVLLPTRYIPKGRSVTFKAITKPVPLSGTFTWTPSGSATTVRWFR